MSDAASPNKAMIKADDQAVAAVFASLPEALPLYALIEQRIMAEYPDATIKVTKTQISFSNRHGFAWAWPPVRRKKDWPKVFCGLTFGLDHQVTDPRIAVSVEPYPRRWTHHVLIAKPEDMDSQVMDWIEQSYTFSLHK